MISAINTSTGYIYVDYYENNLHICSLERTYAFYKTKNISNYAIYGTIIRYLKIYTGIITNSNARLKINNKHEVIFFYTSLSNLR